MPSTEPSIFQSIFEQSPAPAMIIKANAPEYTVIASNEAFRKLSAILPDELFSTAFDEAVKFRKPVKLPAVKDPNNPGADLWQQLEVVPLLDGGGGVSNLLCTYYDISKMVGLENEGMDGRLKAHDLSEQLAASNEELQAVNEDLLVTNEELRRSEKRLSEINRDLENRVLQRTRALSESEARFRTMVEQSAVPMLVTMGRSMVFEIINQPMLDLIGKDASVIGKSWNQAMPELEDQDIISELLDTYDSGRTWEGSEVPIMIYKSGTPELGFYNINYKPLNEAGKTIGMLQSAIDVTDLVKSRLKAEELHRSLELIINMLPASVVVIRGEDLIVELINKANLAYWNKTKEEVLGRPFLDILPELRDQPFPSQLRQVMATGEVIDVQESPVIFTNPDGSTRQTFVDYTYQPLTDSNGAYTGVLVMSFEITDRVESRLMLEQYSDEMQAINEEMSATNEELTAVNEELLRAQQQIEEGQAALRLAIDAAEFGTWFIHSVTREFVTNARLKELFGYYPDEDFSIEQALAQITDEYRGFVTEKLEDAIYNGGDYDVSYPVTGLHDQRLRWLRAIGNLAADPSGAFSAFTGVVMDITDEITAAQKIKTAEENLRMATESGELATWYLNEQLGKIVASPRFNELFGFLPEEEIPYAAALNQIVPEYREMVNNAVIASFTSSANFNVEYPIVGKRDSKKRWIRSVGKFIADKKNGNYITGVMADITEQKTDELRKNDFIGMVSHELKTPLTSLNGYLQLLSKKASGIADPFTTGALENSVKQVKRMTTMINGFLNVSRLESGKIYIDKKRFNMADLIKETEQENLTLYSGYHILFHPVKPAMVYADQDKIGQVINNFISNAVKYSPAGSTIQIACVTINGAAQVSVSDQGLGIESADLPRLFERYFRVANNSHISGFGIGLYLSSEIIKRHEGRIWAESEPGKGSVFYFTLPLTSGTLIRPVAAS